MNLAEPPRADFDPGIVFAAALAVKRQHITMSENDYTLG